MDIIRGSNNSLDTEAGGELAETLRNLYCYFEKRLHESNCKKDRRGIDEVISHLKVLRDAWATMLASHSQPPSPRRAVAADSEIWIHPDLRAA